MDHHLDVTKQIEALRSSIRNQLKLKEGARKVQKISDNPKSAEKVELLIHDINKDIDRMRDELNTLIAQIPTINNEPTKNVPNSEPLSKSDLSKRQVQHYKKQLAIEVQVKEGLEKLLTAAHGTNNSNHELLVMCQDTMVKIMSLKMLILRETQRQAKLSDDDETSSQILNTTDENGFSQPQLLNMSTENLKLKLQTAKNILIATLDVSHNADEKKRTQLRSLWNTSEEEDLLSFSQSLIRIYNRSLTNHARYHAANSGDAAQLLEPYAKSVCLHGTLYVTLYGLTDLDKDFIRDSNAVYKKQKNMFSRANYTSHISSSMLYVTLLADQKKFLTSPPKVPSQSCYVETKSECTLVKNRELVIIVRKAKNDVMVAYNTLTLMEFLNGEVHKIKIPLEPAGYLYCEVQYMEPRARTAKLRRQKKIFARHKPAKNIFTPEYDIGIVIRSNLAHERPHKSYYVVDQDNGVKTKLVELPTNRSLENVASKVKPPEKSLVASLSVKTSRQPSVKKTLGEHSYNLLYVLGRGHFGKVILAESVKEKKRCAIKCIPKAKIIESNDFTMIDFEKKILILASEEKHPFLLNIIACFCTNNHLCFVMEYMAAGDLMTHIHIEMFTESRAKFYSACVLLGLEFLHSHGIMYRDLKLDNLLVGSDGYIKIGDFGLCKFDMWHGTETSTFCGTPEFIAPEILAVGSYTRSIDWWELGVLIYEMILGEPPFPGDDENEIFENIVYKELSYPPYLSTYARNILTKLLVKDPNSRLGSSEKDAEDIKGHPYFEAIDFDALYRRQIKPQYVPKFKRGETTFIEEDMIKLRAVIEPVEGVFKPTKQAHQELFEGFYYDSTIVTS